LFEECFRQKRYRQVIGIAIEAKSLDVLRMAILRASSDEKQQQGDSRSSEELMEYVLDICMGIVQERAFRSEVCDPKPPYEMSKLTVLLLDPQTYLGTAE
jgi:26S proteasome regulatory subunit N2